MRGDEPLRLTDRFEPPHPPLPNPGRLMRLLGTIILILFGTVDRLRDQFPVSNTIAAQLICNDLPGVAAVTAQ